MAASPAFAQGTGSSTTLSAWSLMPEGRHSGRGRRGEEQRHRSLVHGGHERSGRFTIAAVRRHVHGHRLADGFKTAQLPDVTVLTATPASVTSRWMSASSRKRRRDGRYRDRADAERERRDDAPGEAAPAAAGHHAHGARRVVSLPGVETSAATPADRPSTFTHDGHRHHAGRRQRAGQAGKRRLLHVYPADDGLGRGNHRVDVDARRRGERRRSAVIRMETGRGPTASAVRLQHWRNQAGTTEEDSVTRKNKAAGYGPEHAVLVHKRDIPDGGGEYFINDVACRPGSAWAPHRQGQAVLLLQLRRIQAAGVAHPHAVHDEPRR